MDEFISRTVGEARMRLRSEGSQSQPLSHITEDGFVVGNRTEMRASQRYPSEFAESIANLAIALQSPVDADTSEAV